MSDQSTEVISFRLSVTEAALLKKQAAAEYRPLGQYMRLQVQKSLGVLPSEGERAGNELGGVA